MKPKAKAQAKAEAKAKGRQQKAAREANGKECQDTLHRNPTRNKTEEEETLKTMQEQKKAQIQQEDASSALPGINELSQNISLLNLKPFERPLGVIRHLTPGPMRLVAHFVLLQID